MIKCFLLLIFLVTSAYTQQQKNQVVIKSTEEPEKVVQETTNSDSVVSEKPTKIEIVNIPEDKWWDIYLPYISGLFGVIIGWLLAYFSQNKLFERQLKIQRAENWLKEFNEVTIELAAVESTYSDTAFIFLDFVQKNNTDGVIEYKEKFTSINEEMIKKVLKAMSMLDSNKKDENELFELLLKYTNMFRENFNSNVDITKAKKAIKDAMDEIVSKSFTIHGNRKKELKEI